VIEASAMTGLKRNAVVSEATAQIHEEIISRASTQIEPLPMLEIIFSGLTSELASAMKSKIGILTDVSVGSIRYEPWGNLVQSLEAFAVCGIYKAKNLAGSFVTCMSPRFFYDALEVQMGGSGGTRDIPVRHLTAIERRLALKVLEILAHTLQISFVQRVASVEFIAEGIEMGQQMVNHMAHKEPCVMATMQVGDDSGPDGSWIHFIFPMETLSPVAPQLSKMFFGERVGIDANWRQHISTKIRGADVSLEACLHRTSISMSDILNWKIGETINLGIVPDSEVTLFCAGMPVLYGEVGRKRGNVAVSIVREEGEIVEDKKVALDARGII
jgi:flagellar motor switch protein FliM